MVARRTANGTLTQALLLEFKDNSLTHKIDVTIELTGREPPGEVQRLVEVKAIDLMKRAVASISHSQTTAAQR